MTIKGFANCLAEQDPAIYTYGSDKFARVQIDPLPEGYTDRKIFENIIYECAKENGLKLDHGEPEQLVFREKER